jgi:hypothetical protein
VLRHVSTVYTQTIIEVGALIEMMSVRYSGQRAWFPLSDSEGKEVGIVQVSGSAQLPFETDSQAYKWDKRSEQVPSFEKEVAFESYLFKMSGKCAEHAFDVETGMEIDLSTGAL